MSQETFKLQFLDGPRQGDEIPLADNITTLGRSDDNTIIIDDPSISRKHLTFYVEDDSVSAEDMGSSHGSTLNMNPLNGRQSLTHADALMVGNLHIKVIGLSETLRNANHLDIFGHPEEIEEKFNSEREDGGRRLVRPTPPQDTHDLNSRDEITGVFDFSEMRKNQAAEATRANANDGTVPLTMPEGKGPPMTLIGVLIGFIILLLISLGYLFFIHDKEGLTAPPSGTINGDALTTPSAPVTE